MPLNWPLHTVPHVPLIHTSRRPLKICVPFTRRTSPSWQSTIVGRKLLIAVFQSTYYAGLTRSAYHPGIFKVDTVMVRDGRTVHESSLISSASQVIQHNGISSLAEHGQGRQGESSRWESQLSAHHHSLRGSPEVIAHSAPGKVDTNFHTSFCGGWPSNQADSAIVTDYNRKTKKSWPACRMPVPCSIIAFQ